MHNTNSFLSIIDSNFDSIDNKEDILDLFQISRLGLIPKSYIYSVNSIKELNISDSDWISLLNTIYNSIKVSYCSEENDEIDINELKHCLCGELDSYAKWYSLTIGSKFDFKEFNNDQVEILSQKIGNTLDILRSYKDRKYLKPWWKTVFEFSNFMNHYFIDDSARDTVCNNICSKLKKYSEEFRSQIVKLLKYITNRLVDEKYVDFPKMEDGDFFVIQRQNNFLQTNKIEKLIIYLQASRIIGIVGDESEKKTNIEMKYYGKKLNKTYTTKKL